MFFVVKFAECPIPYLKRRKSVRSISVKKFSIFAEFYISSIFLKQFNSIFFFETGNSMAEAWLSNVKIFCRFGVMLKSG